MMRVTLWTRQFLYTGALAIAAVLAMTLLVSGIARRHIFHQFETSLQDQIQLVAQATAGTADTALNARVRQLGMELTTRITIVDTLGRVLADSRADPARMEDHRYRPEISAALREGSGQRVHTSRTLGEDMLYVARRIPSESGPRVVRVSVALTEIGRLSAGINARLLTAAGILLLIALVLSLAFTQTLVRPLRRLSTAADRIAAGDLDVRVGPLQPDELGRLATAMNRMAEQIQRLLKAAGTEKAQLEATIAAMVEGVAVLDCERRLVLTNASFRRAFGIESVRPGSYYWEVLRSTDFRGLVDATEPGQDPVNREVNVGDRTYSATAVRLAGERADTVVVLHDVTAYKELEKVKADLVANVSHELRTPLTAIRGFTETLSLEVGDEQRRFLAIIERHTDRLIALVNDLLLLSQLDGGPRVRPHQPEELDIAEIARDAFRILSRRAAEKGLTTSVEVAPGMPRVHADRYLLEQLFINLIDNAVKFTATGGVTIRIGLLDARRVRIEVVDTGAGIPAEHLPRIFERFYVVDPNRARELGGTGLGLAIVRHIVLSHHGSIDVTSTPGQGTTFTILLPA